MTGDGYTVARVTSMQNTSGFAKAGIMIRSSTAAGAADVLLDVKPDGGIEFMGRNAQGGSTSWFAGMGTSGPAWLMLVRSGSTVSAYAASDGSPWTPLGTINVTLPATVDVGLVVSSHSTQ